MFSRPSLKALALSLLATGSLVHAGPCDIYASGGTPCIAAHGTTRALYDEYTGPLYQVSTRYSFFFIYLASGHFPESYVHQASLELLKSSKPSQC